MITSIAYHIGKLIMPGVLLLERDRLTSITTWHDDGLTNTLGLLSTMSISMQTYTKELYAAVLLEETDLLCGIIPIGFAKLATDCNWLEYYQHVAAFNRFYRMKVVEMFPEEVKEQCSIINVQDLLVRFHVESGGRANAANVTIAFAKGARMSGVNIFEGVEVLGVTMSKDQSSSSRSLPKVTGVNLLSSKTTEALTVVNCARMWARQLGERNGVTIPNQVVEH